jgi:CheY-like chemotaxis protein
VIEDNAIDETILVATLNGAGYAVETLATGAQAVARCRDRAFDAILLDLVLPDASGVDVLAAIRAEGQNRDVPVVIVSVLAERGTAAAFAVSDVLPKPAEGKDVLQALERAGVSAGRSGVVLVVDDDPGSLKLMQATLGQLGYQAICSADGEAGLRAALQSRPIAVVLDLLMPGVDGFQFLERFRGTPEGRQTPVIIWSVKDLSDADLSKLRESAQAVIQKGSGTAALLTELESSLAKRRRRA